MITYAFLFLRAQSLRLVLTVAGIALCILLMTFLVGIYRGVEDGSVSYVRSTGASLWILQANTTNILRGFSVLTLAHGTLIQEVPGVRSSSPVLFRLTSAQTPGGDATVYLAGYDVRTGAGGPPCLRTGRSVRQSGEIVLDEAFAKKWNVSTGDRLSIQDRMFTVVGLSGSTNMFVIQYGFACLEDVQSLYGVSGIVSAYIVHASGPDVALLAARILEEVPGVTVVDQDQFVRQNLREMRSGFLPVLMILAVLGGTTLAAVVSLLLTLTVLEHRNEYAVLKAIGAPRRFLPFVLTAQAAQLALAGLVIASLLFIPTIAVVRHLAPEVDALIVPSDVAIIVSSLAAIVVVSTAIPLHTLKGIYPTEAFA